MQRSFGASGPLVPAIGQGSWYSEQGDRREAIAAFRRGLRSRTLYAEDYEHALGEDVEAMRARHVGEPSGPATVGERARFAAFGIVGTIIGLTFFALCLPLLPLGLVNVFRKRARMAREAKGTA